MWRARLEVPEFKKCCFCIPLRYGLLAWAYFKLVVLVYADLYHTYETVRLFHGKRGFKDYMLIPFVVDLVLFADILFTILFIVSGHKKNLKGLKVYYYYCLVMLCISTICFIVYWIIHLFGDVLVTSMALVLQMYILLLVRSEVKKLDNSINIQIVNNETQSIRVEKSEGNAILQEKTEDTESRTKDIGLEYTN